MGVPVVDGIPISVRLCLSLFFSLLPSPSSSSSSSSATSPAYGSLLLLRRFVSSTHAFIAISQKPLTLPPSQQKRKIISNIPSSLANPSLTLTPQSLNFACAALSWLKDVVRCCSSCVSWFFTLLSWAVGREERSTGVGFFSWGLGGPGGEGLWRSCGGSYWFGGGIGWLWPLLLLKGVLGRVVCLLGCGVWVFLAERRILRSVCDFVIFLHGTPQP